ncbi:bacillithiol system redox-active protein YtxJ [Ekhidna sp.]|uniref:bacillithiol system redox-active protein YtxJ n=1 Tax=Ekhidna sp. TaxID=2608089 RepID=UPI003B50D5E8
MLSGLFSKSEKTEIPWKQLNNVSELIEVDEVSKHKPVLLFKHSTRCSISSMALSRFERSYSENPPFELYFVDLIAFRDISNAIAERYGVKHESPQTVLVKDGKAIFNSSHMGINYDELNKVAQNL